MEEDRPVGGVVTQHQHPDRPGSAEAHRGGDAPRIIERDGMAELAGHTATARRRADRAGAQL